MSDHALETNPGEHRDGALLLMVMAILLFNALDGIFTLLLIDTGQILEWNPVLALLMERDIQLFANVKSAVTAAGVFLLVVFVDRSLFRLIPVRSVLEVIFAGYAVLLVYHFSLMFRLSG